MKRTAKISLVTVIPAACLLWSFSEFRIVQGRGGFSTLIELLAVAVPIVTATASCLTGWLWIDRDNEAALHAQPPDPVPSTDTQPYRVVTPDGGVSVSVTGNVSPELLKRIRELLSFAAGGGK